MGTVRGDQIYQEEPSPLILMSLELKQKWHSLIFLTYPGYSEQIFILLKEPTFMTKSTSASLELLPSSELLCSSSMDSLPPFHVSQPVAKAATPIQTVLWIGVFRVDFAKLKSTPFRMP